MKAGKKLTNFVVERHAPALTVVAVVLPLRRFRVQALRMERAEDTNSAVETSQGIAEPDRFLSAQTPKKRQQYPRK